MAREVVGTVVAGLAAVATGVVVMVAQAVADRWAEEEDGGDGHQDGSGAQMEEGGTEVGHEVAVA